MNYLRDIFGSPPPPTPTPISSVNSRVRAQTTVEPPITHSPIKEACNELGESIKSCCNSCYKNAVLAGSCVLDTICNCGGLI